MSFDLKKSLSQSGHRFALPALHGSADAFMLAQAALELKSQNRMLVVMTAQATDAQRLLEEIPWFTPSGEQDGNEALRCCLLPDWETLPYDSFSPHQDLVSKRLAALYEVLNRRCDVLIVPATTALLRNAPPSFLAAHTFWFKQGETLNEERLRSQLTLAGYNNVPQVMSPGEYSLRGGIIDLFPMGSSLPYRLDLFGDKIGRAHV
jgi:transcription-repair coupling factor (superfamily II helicase)